jgi:hypothetical protein
LLFFRNCNSSIVRLFWSVAATTWILSSPKLDWLKSYGQMKPG